MSKLRKEFEQTVVFQTLNKMLRCHFSDDAGVYVVDDLIYQSVVDQINAAWWVFQELRK